MVTGHGKLWSYLHRFGLTDNLTCPCGGGGGEEQQQQQKQTTDHLIFQCKNTK